MGNIGSSQPTNRTDRKVVTQKLENANKTGVLSLREHKLETLPPQVFQIKTLRTLDVSNNKLKRLGPELATLSSLKSFNCDDNELPAGSLEPVVHLTKLQNLMVGGNRLGKPVSMMLTPGKTTTTTLAPPDPLPTPLPPSLKQLKLDHNYLLSVPQPIFTSMLTKLEKLDLSYNHLATVPEEISTLVSLNELNLDHNTIVSLPESVGALTKLKSLSLRHNHIRVSSTQFTRRNPQPLPKSLFTNTPLIDLNLHGNPMTSTQLNEFEGFAQFLDRREKVKTKDLYGGALTTFDVCGLE